MKLYIYMYIETTASRYVHLTEPFGILPHSLLLLLLLPC